MSHKRALPLSRRRFLAGAGALGLSIKFPAELLAADGKVNFYNWDTYIGETTLDDFASETGSRQR